MDRGDRPQDGGDPVTSIFQEMGDRLVGTAYGILGHREDAREAVQEAFLKCWRRRHDAPSLRTPKAWVFSVVLNAARDLRRRRKVRRTGTLPPEDAMPPSTTVDDPALTAERREAVSRAREAIGHLPDAEKEVFLLRQNAELTFTQIGETLGIPVGTAKTRMRKALGRLREALEPGTTTGTAVEGSGR